MKKLALMIFASLALSQSAFAATSALTESLLEFEAITNTIGAPSFDVIGPNEFIVDIRRVTRSIDEYGEVRYEIVTRRTDSEALIVVSAEKACPRDIKYLAILEVAPNPGIGPNIITVLSIERIHHHHD